MNDIVPKNEPCHICGKTLEQLKEYKETFEDKEWVMHCISLRFFSAICPVCEDIITSVCYAAGR